MENCTIYYEQNSAHIILNIDNLVKPYINSNLNISNTKIEHLKGALLDEYYKIAIYLVSEIIYEHTEIRNVILNLIATNKLAKELTLKGILIAFMYIEKVCYSEYTYTEGKNIKTIKEEETTFRIFSERKAILKRPFQKNLKEMGITEIK